MTVYPAAPHALLKMRARSFPHLYDWLAAVALAVVAVLSVWTFRDYGLSWDDYTHSEYGDLLVAFFSSGFTDRRALSFVNLYKYGGGFDIAAALLAKLSPYGLFETRRLLGAVVGIVGLIATWRTGRRVGGPFAGLIALSLLAACPLFYGHMFMNPKDAPFATAMAILLLGLIRLFEDYPRPSPKARVLFGFGLGLAVGTRILAGFDAFGVLAALALIVGVQTRKDGPRATARQLGAFLLSLLPAFVVAYAIMALVWPWSVVEPLNPIRAVIYFSDFFEKPWRELFGGQLILVPDMPATYVPTLAGLQLPVVLLILGLGGLAVALADILRRSVPLNRRAVLLLIAVVAVAPVLVTMVVRPAMYNGIRHFIFLLPPFAVLGGLGAARIADWMRRGPRIAPIAGALLFAVGIASPVVAMARLHPFEYTYFNELAGGVQGARGRFMLDYWGLSLTQASRTLAAKLAERHETAPADGHWRIAVCGPHPPVKVALGSSFETTWDPKGAQFAMMLGEFYCARLSAPVLVEIVRDGVVYARVYDIRGLSISNLLTIPGL